MADKYFKGSFSQDYGYGYYAFVNNNGLLVIGEERGREGGNFIVENIREKKHLG